MTADVYTIASSADLRAGWPYPSANALMAFIGDSLTDPGYGELHTGYAVNARAGGKLKPIINIGVAGNTVNDLLTRINNQYDATPSTSRGLAGLPRLGDVFGRIGTNNARGGASINPTIQQQYRDLIAAVLTYADRFTLFGVPPCGAPASGAGVNSFNAWLTSYSGTVPANFPTGGDYPSPLANDQLSLPDRADAQFMPVLLPPLVATGTTMFSDDGGYALFDPADGTWPQVYRCFVDPLAAAPFVYDETMTTIVGGGGDVTPPTMNGALSVSSLTTTSYTVSWPAASDNIGVTGYQISLNGGSWGDLGVVLSTPVSGRTPGAVDAVRVRAYDAAGLFSDPLATNVTLQSVQPPTGTPGPMEVGYYFQMMLRAS